MKTMQPASLARLKGQFVQGPPKKCKQPKPGQPIFYDNTMPKYCGLKCNGWIQPVRGAE